MLGPLDGYSRIYSDGAGTINVLFALAWTDRPHRLPESPPQNHPHPTPCNEIADWNKNITVFDFSGVNSY